MMTLIFLKFSTWSLQNCNISIRFHIVFHCLRSDSFNYIILFSPFPLQWFNGNEFENECHQLLNLIYWTPNFCITIVDGNTFSVAIFWKFGYNLSYILMETWALSWPSSTNWNAFTWIHQVSEGSSHQYKVNQSVLITAVIWTHYLKSTMWIYCMYSSLEKVKCQVITSHQPDFANLRLSLNADPLSFMRQNPVREASLLLISVV